MTTLELDPDKLYVLWAAMIAMVRDIHAPMDQLSEENWELAEQLLKEIDDTVNVVVPR